MTNSFSFAQAHMVLPIDYLFAFSLAQAQKSSSPVPEALSNP
jgi:hypothetical protein